DETEPFTVEVDGTPVDARLNRDPLDPVLWDALFATAQVGTYQFRDLSGRDLRSFSSTRVHRFITDVYRDVALASPTAFPAVDSEALIPLRRIGEHDQHLLRMEDSRRESRDEQARGRLLRGRRDIPLDDWRRRSAADAAKRWGIDDPFAMREAYWEQQRADVISGKAAPDPAFDLSEARRFYGRPEGRDTYRNDDEPMPPPPPRPDVPAPDFHQELGFLADHPELLRRLGLVLDLIIDIPAVLTGGVRVVPTFDLVDGNDIAVQPLTRFERDGDLFVAQSQDTTRQRRGLLCLNSEDRYQVLGLDVDGSALKVSDFVLNLERQLWRNEPPPSASGDGVRVFLPERDRPDHISLPALRTSGFAVVEQERADRITARLARSKDVNAHLGDPRLELWAEDITRGYRIEVQEADGRWQSLCGRDVTYAVTGAPSFSVLGDEGYVKGASTSEVPKAGGPLYLHESMFGWDGWSLVVSRPGPAIPIQGRSLADPQEVAPTDFPVVIAQSVPNGSLPRLRFGATYRFRARTVDLAGNSTTVIDETLVSPEVRHVRFDPVVSPAIVPRWRYTEGESLRHLVIRSDIDRDAATYATSPPVLDALADWDHEYRPVTERHIAPPKVAQVVAELHRRFDDYIGPGKDHQRGLAIAKREQGTFLDTGIVDIDNPGGRLPVVGIELVSPSRRDTPAEKAARAAALAGRLAAFQAMRGKDLEPGDYVIHDTARLMLPYLPDPVAVGAAFFGLPGTEDAGGKPTSTVVDFSGEWPDRAPFRLRLAEGASGIDTSEAGVLTVALPPSYMVDVALSCAIDKDALEAMGIWDLLPADARDRMVEDAVKGRMWLLTPGEQITLVHAVQHPLRPPEIEADRYQPYRRVGATYAWFARELWCHTRSTGRIDMEAAWTEYVDDVNLPAPKTEHRTGHAFDLSVDAAEADGEGWIRVDEHDQPRFGIRVADGSIQHIEDPVHRAVHELGDTKRRRIHYTPVGTTRFREYFPAAITADPANITSRGRRVQLDVPNAARPAAPMVRYIVPTFSWREERVDADTPVFRRRRTGGLRVFLDRPWWSSGEGELLGVVLRQPVHQRHRVFDRLPADVSLLHNALRSTGRATEQLSAPELGRLLEGAEDLGFSTRVLAAAKRVRARLVAGDGVDIISLALAGVDRLEPYVTDWGADPVWTSGTLPADHPRPEHFTRAGVEVGEQLTLKELGNDNRAGATVAVAGHPVEYHHERGLWFCDIELDSGLSYFPFVRLALARYQPHSLGDCHLSAVVRADFAQLAAGRALTVFLPSTDLLRVAVTGVGGVNDLGDGWPFRAGGNDNFPVSSRVVTAGIERRIPGVVGDLGWQPVGSPTVLHAPNDSTGEVTWAGSLPLPEPLTFFQEGSHGVFGSFSSQGELRIVVREYDELPSDPEGSSDLLVQIGPQTTGRLVYADAIVL
ncbi:MAG: hypothetical protein QOG64_1580, partial [Acidimicrobiaceae bacterium]|nr:hypothetical protein [Acidimicrobiaceae bacterium]